ncbi:sugar transferase [Skermania sp. ID1734]|uniref:sugar transferase n=1 Tax=Skermania sp. ID1734 TaxID=2597516 RepID=UPI002103471E|nr:sugar transferase [Skermania sp. ID1734]
MAQPVTRVSRKDWEPALIRRTWITDTIVIAASVAAAQALRFGALHVNVSTKSHAGLNYTLFSILLIVAWIGALVANGTHTPRVFGSGPDEYRLIISTTCWLFGVVAIVALLFQLDFARGYLAIAFPVGLAGLLWSRWVSRRSIAHRRERGENQTSVLLVGRERAVREVALQFEQSLASGHRVVGVCVPGHEGQPGATMIVGEQKLPIFGDEHSVIAALEHCGADTVAVTATEELGHEGLRKLMWELDPYDVDMVVSPGVCDIAGPRLVMRPVAGMPLIHVEKPTYEGAKRWGKLAFDLSFATFALLVVAPIMVLTALAIKLTSKGPVFYRQTRVGADGKEFQMLKFRSMVAGADMMLSDLLAYNEGAGALFKIREDPRVTRVGKFIRRFSIDELPQFINVLRREMSVVGPRPPLPRELDSWGNEVHRRLLVKPGVTGLWQVSGRSDLSWEESVRLDLSYVENWSMVGDLLIIVKTLRAVTAGEGAY